MKKKVLAVIVFVFSLASIFYFVFQELSRNKLASLRIASNVDIPISVNGRQVGMKFYEGVDKPGQVDIKIGDYETRVITHAGIKTIVNRNFERDKSYGETLSFEETGLAEPIVAIVTDPIGARVSIDDKFYGVAPLNVEGLTEGKHKLDVALDGYVRDTFSINLAANFKMTAFVDLKAEPVAEAESMNLNTASPADEYVKILNTPNGFLRVRSEPNTTSNEIGRVHDGEKYKFLSVDTKTHWFQIQYNATSSGWVSDVYAAKVN